MSTIMETLRKIDTGAGRRANRKLIQEKVSMYAAPSLEPCLDSVSVVCSTTSVPMNGVVSWITRDDSSAIGKPYSTVTYGRPGRDGAKLL